MEAVFQKFPEMVRSVLLSPRVNRQRLANPEPTGIPETQRRGECNLYHLIDFRPYWLTVLLEKGNNNTDDAVIGQQ